MLSLAGTSERERGTAMTEENRDKVERLKEHTEKWTALAAEMNRAGADPSPLPARGAAGRRFGHASATICGTKGEAFTVTRSSLSRMPMPAAS